MKIREMLEETLAEEKWWRPVKTCDFIKKYIFPIYGINGCEDCKDCERCSILIPLSLDKEIVEPEPKVDWSKVKVDTPILVRYLEGGGWLKRYFAGYGNGKIYTFPDGRTSWSNPGLGNDYWDYNCAKLADDVDQ